MSSAVAVRAVMVAALLGAAARAALVQAAPIQASAPQSTVIPQAALEAVSQLDCVFTAGVSGRWGGDGHADAVAGGSAVRLRLTRVDVTDGTATQSRGGRTVTVSVRSDRSNLYFLDAAAPDGVALTTVFAQEVGARRLRAVLTQTGRRPSQAYGNCRIQAP